MSEWNGTIGHMEGDTHVQVVSTLFWWELSITFTTYPIFPDCIVSLKYTVFRYLFESSTGRHNHVMCRRVRIFNFSVLNVVDVAMLGHIRAGRNQIESKRIDYARHTWSRANVGTVISNFNLLNFPPQKFLPKVYFVFCVSVSWLWQVFLKYPTIGEFCDFTLVALSFLSMLQYLSCLAWYCKCHAYRRELGLGSLSISGLPKVNDCLSSGIDNILLYVVVNCCWVLYQWSASDAFLLTLWMWELCYIHWQNVYSQRLHLSMLVQLAG